MSNGHNCGHNTRYVGRTLCEKILVCKICGREIRQRIGRKGESRFFSDINTFEPSAQDLEYANMEL